MRMALMACAVMSVSPSWALNKCTDASGKVTFTDGACPQGKGAVVKAVATPAASAQGSHPVDAVIQAHLDAGRQGNFDALKRLSADRETLDKITPGKQRDELMSLLKMVLPPKVSVAGREFSADGQNAVVKVSGPHVNPMTSQPTDMKGIVTLKRVANAWLIVDSQWGEKKW